MSLNPEQLAAVEHVSGPLLVLAGAGSGKTRVLTHKIAHLVKAGLYEPGAILAITFTNKAAKEMAQRTKQLLPDSCESFPFIGTFHAFCGQILRKEFHHLGRARNFVIYDAADQKQLIRDILKDQQSTASAEQLQQYMSQISAFKTEMISQDTVLSRRGEYGEVLARVYDAYQKALAQNNAIDFDDMLYYCNRLFEQHPAVLAAYQQQYRYVLIDEYQDTNHSQYQLAQYLAAEHKNITVVGDFDQTIYSWRGADVENILNFESDFPGATVIKLEQNYRSTQRILDAANGLIEYNSNRRPKRLWTENNPGEPLTYFVAFDEKEEAQYIVEQILKVKAAENRRFGDFAVLYRTNAQSRSLEEGFGIQKVPYQLIGGVQFYARSEIKDVVALLKLIANPDDTMAFSRAIQRPPRGVGATSLKKIQDLAYQSGDSAYQQFKENKLPLAKKQCDAITAFFQMIMTLRQRYEQMETPSIRDLIDLALDESGYRTYLNAGKQENSQDRLDNVMEFKSTIEDETQPLGDFLNDVSLMGNLDKGTDQDDAVTLMTMHHAKGLEYPHVFIAGFEEGLTPFYKTQESAEGLEEERRLAYGGITRGEKHVTLVGTNQRTLYGDVWYHDVSQFLKELPKDTFTCLISDRVNSQDAPILSKLREAGISYPVVSKSLKKATIQAQDIDFTILIGDTVRHKVWGEGVVKHVEGEGDRLMYHISFRGDIKKLMAKYTPIEKV